LNETKVPTYAIFVIKILVIKLGHEISTMSKQ